MSAQNLFDETKIKELTPVEVKAEDLVGEDKKYKTVDDLAQSKAEADAFIERLKLEKQGVMEELEKYSQTDRKLDEVLDQLAKRQEQSAGESTPGIQTPAEPTQTTENSQFDISDVEKLVGDLLTKENRKTTENTNLDFVAQELNKEWGNEAQYRLQKRAEELGESLSNLQEIAKTKPKLFLELVKPRAGEAVPSTPSVPNSSVDQSKVLGNSSNEKNYAYYEKIRKESPEKYFSSIIQNEMFTQAKEMGDKFYE